MEARRFNCVSNRSITSGCSSRRAGVVNGTEVHVKGPKGELKRHFSAGVSLSMEDRQVQVTRSSDEASDSCIAWNDPGIDTKHGNRCQHRLYQGIRD